MNSFDGFSLTGANTSRYLPIWGNAAGMIGAYRKYAQPHKKYEASPLGVGQTPLFLLDGVLSEGTLRRAVEKLKLTAYVAIYRPIDASVITRYEDMRSGMCKWGGLRYDGSIREYWQEEIDRYESTSDPFLKESLENLVRPFYDYAEVCEEYIAAIAVPLIDAATGKNIVGDLNEYLFHRAKLMFPLGVESVLEANTKQSAIPKPRYFVDGLEHAPAPKGVRQCGQEGMQLTLYAPNQASIDDTIEALRDFARRRVEQDSMVMLADLIMHCAGMGLYKGNITLYAIGSAMRDFIHENVIYYDSVCYWRYAEIRDISSWFLRIYEKIETRRGQGNLEAALFYDSTDLKRRIERIFSIEPTQRKDLDTLGMAIVQANKWIAEHLRYPIAFLDDMLRRLFWEKRLYGEQLRQYDAYFTAERCEWLRARIPQADALARQAIEATVGYDPDTTRHGLSNLPRGHYASAFYSTEEYISEMGRKLMWE